MIKTVTTLEEYRLHDCIAYQLTRLAKLMEVRLETDFAVFGINRLQWCVLSGVHIENHTTPSDLAQHIGLSRSSLSRILKTMDTNGLIERNLIGGDGRTRTISLTCKGREKLLLCWEKILTTQEQLLKKLEPDQFDHVAVAVDAMLEGETVNLDFPS